MTMQSKPVTPLAKVAPADEHCTFAFFDVDDTLIDVKSMLSFQAFWYASRPDNGERERYLREIEQHLHERASWEVLNRRYYHYFAGRKVVDVEQAGREWFRWQTASRDDFFHAGSLAELRWHQAEGREPVFVSGSFPALLQPVADHLGVRQILATRMEVAGDRYTGEILPPQTIGTGKAEAIGLFLEAVGGKSDDCYAYGDDISDLPMLQAVGHPRVVSGGRGLVECARERGWTVIPPR
ncbi:HAD family hydrolase [Marinimicrobium alkaliphilum]|uniref:HAD family hydrolase n=1 Tax=Marinimicrobium alkaliphilum TaxID=2202654 RepID=UPI000DB9384C|nr:HAD family hydrolase [Marinimicrobium alkaliphilum]